MTREEKQLLLKDLCARLPYGVEVWNSQFLDSIEEYHPSEILTLSNLDYYIKESIEVKPYLRPMSSMTEEEKKELKEEHKKDEKVYVEVLEKISKGDESARGTAIPHFAADWCNAHYFDYRIVPSTGKTLIESGLALEAPAWMYKEK